MKWVIVLFLASAIQGFLLAVIFISNVRNRSKVYLGIYLLMFSITVLYYVGFWLEIKNIPRLFIWIGSTSSWILPGALYLFYKNPQKWDRSVLLHLLPAVLFSLYFLSSPYFMQFGRQFFSLMGLGISLIKIVVFFVYGILLIKRSWVKGLDLFLFWGYAAFFFGMILYLWMVRTGHYSETVDYLICGVFVILTYGLVYMSQRNFLRDKIPVKKYASSSLTPEDGIRLVSRINAAFKEHKYFRDPEFNLSRLAEELHTPKYRISQALSHYSETSFSALINEYRVTDAHEKLASNYHRHLKIDVIGEEAGFKNKVSFYQHFKKRYGLAPGEYRDESLARASNPID